LRARLATSFS